MQKLFPDAETIPDTRSGINFKRKGVRFILEQASKGYVSEVVVADRDRQCKFAFELVERILQFYRVKQTETPNSPKISLSLSTFSIVESMVKEDTIKTKTRTDKINQTNCQLMLADQMVQLCQKNLQSSSVYHQ